MIKTIDTYPEELWNYYSDGTKKDPAWMDACYSSMYNEYLFVSKNYCYHTENLNVDVELVKKKYLKAKKIDSINSCIDDWHSFFYAEMLSTIKQPSCYIDKNGDHTIFLGIKANCLLIHDNKDLYQVVIPKNKKLLYDLIDGKVCFNIDIFVNNIDTLVFEYTKGRFNNIEDFFSKKKTSNEYFGFLREINLVRIKKTLEYSISNRINILIFLGNPITKFPFSEIGFWSNQEKIYYNPLYNYFISKTGLDNLYQYVYKSISNIIDLKYQLIPIPLFASPNKILYENNLNVSNIYNDKLCHSMFENFELSIYPDNFYKEYGYRSISDQRKIFYSICKYKYIAYDWLTKRGVKMLINTEELKEMIHYTNI